MYFWCAAKSNASSLHYSDAPGALLTQNSSRGVPHLALRFPFSNMTSRSSMISPYRGPPFDLLNFYVCAYMFLYM